MPHFTHSSFNDKSTMPHLTRPSFNPTPKASSLIDDKALMIKNVPTTFPEAAITAFFMHNPYHGVWACNANRRFNSQTRSSEVLPGQYFINFFSAAAASQFREFWSMNSFFGTQLRIETRMLRPGQPASMASEKDYERLEQRITEFDSLTFSTLGASLQSVPLVSSALNASAPAFVAAASGIAASAPVSASTFAPASPAISARIALKGEARASARNADPVASSSSFAGARAPALSPPSAADWKGKGKARALPSPSPRPPTSTRVGPFGLPFQIPWTIRPNPQSHSHFPSSSPWDSGYDSDIDSDDGDLDLQFVLRRPVRWESLHGIGEMEWQVMPPWDLPGKGERVWPPRPWEGTAWMTEGDWAQIRGLMRRHGFPVGGGWRRRKRRGPRRLIVGQGRPEGPMREEMSLWPGEKVVPMGSGVLVEGSTRLKLLECW